MMGVDQSESSGDFRAPRFLDVGEAKVCYRQAGNGPALVLLHGFPLSGLTWRNLAPELSEYFTCYAFDLVGLGDSTSRDTSHFSSPGQARVMQQALRMLGVDSYALMGNDTGGWIARELALLEPERVTKLILTNTEIPGHRPPWIPVYQLLVRLPGARFAMRHVLASRHFRRSPLGFGGCFSDLDFIDGEFADLFLSPLQSNRRLDAMFEFLAQMKFRRIDRFARLHGKLTMPAAFFWGSADPTFPEKDARAMAAQFPNVARFTPIPGAKLFMYEEQPDIVTKLVLEFLAPAARPADAPGA